MARRTVENFSGFISASPTVAKSLKKSLIPPPPVPGRSRPAGSDKKTLHASTSKSTKAALPTKRNEQQNTHQISKVQKPKRNIANEKNIPANITKVREELKIRHNETKIEPKLTKSDKNTKDNTSDCLSDISNEEEYHDDFEDYESDFESDSSINSTKLISKSQSVEINQATLDVFEVKFPLCVEEKLEPFLDEKFEVNSLEQTIEIGLKNFQTAGKRKRDQEAKDKIKTRGAVLMEMIKLDTVSYSLLDLPAIPYEQYIKMYGRSNMTQVQTQTHDDNAEKEIQTNEIELFEKWTQRPIILENKLNCSSVEYQKAKLGVGDNESDDGHRLTNVSTLYPDRVCAVGHTILAILEQQAMDRAVQRLIIKKSDLDFSNGHLSPALSTIKFLAGCSVTRLEFARITSSTETLVTIHEIMQPDNYYVICIWFISNMENPEYALKCLNPVISFCSIPKSTCGFVAGAHADGSICLWDLRESRLHHQNVDSISCPLRSPSFNTALSVDQGHKSKIVGLSTVTYSNINVTNEDSPDELCSLDEDFVLTVWTVVDSWAEASEISEHKNAGTAPWSSVRLTKLQIVDANKNIPRYLSDGVVATCMCLNSNQEAFIGTNSRLVFRCNLGGHKVWPSYYTYESTREHFTINWLDICPFDSNYFLAACSNSKVMLYRTSRQESLRQFFTSPNVSNQVLGSIVKVQWCIGYPEIIFGLDSLSSIHMWDLYENVNEPIMTVLLRKRTVTSMALTSMRRNRNCYMGLVFIDGEVEMHQIKLGKRKSVEDNDYDSDMAITRYMANF